MCHPQKFYNHKQTQKRKIKIKWRRENFKSTSSKVNKIKSTATHNKVVKDMSIRDAIKYKAHIRRDLCLYICGFLLRLCTEEYIYISLLCHIVY